MPLLHNNQENVDHSPRKGSIFSKRPRETDSTSHSFFGTRRSSSSMKNDPAIRAARQKVSQAEEAERAADKALSSARAAVLAAKDLVKHLEKEASEDAEHAKARHEEAKSVTKSAKHLGRHG